MKKNKKCISLELAKELQKVAKEAGFKLPKSEYSWIIGKQKPPYLDDTDIARITIEIDNDKKKRVKYVSAYDTSELGEILPSGYKSWKYTDYDTTLKWTCSLNENSVAKLDTEAEARGKLLCYLIKNKLLT